MMTPEHHLEWMQQKEWRKDRNHSLSQRYGLWLRWKKFYRDRWKPAHLDNQTAKKQAVNPAWGMW